MTDYSGNVIVITGAASGIGKELACRYAAKGAKLSLADIDGENLAKLGNDLKAKGAEVITSVFDVSDYNAMDNFSKMSLLFPLCCLV